MSWRASLLAVAAALLAAALAFHFFERRLSEASLAFGVQPGVIEALEASLEDLKALAGEDPSNAELYRRRFEDTRTLLNHLRILEHSREDVARRRGLLIVGLFVALLSTAGTGLLLRQHSQERRLERLQEALAQLAEGRTDVAVGERRRDLIGRIAAMVERTSRVMARDRRRLAQLANLSSWQEAARRHAHEMRTPLTGARLELTRLRGLLEKEQPLGSGEEIRQAGDSALQELERLAAFTRGFTSFARLPRPRPERRDLGRLVAEVVETFAGAWPNLELRLEPSDETAAEPLEVCVDRDMLRQVLVNLCDNSSLALGERRGRQRFRLEAAGSQVLLEVTDDGPGIDPAVRGRLFEPYTTTRGIGEGMGLGLAISKKILLEHGGDLELAETSEAGTTFRLSFPRAEPEPRPEPSPQSSPQP